MNTDKLPHAIRFLLFLFLFFGAMFFAKAFLVPIVFAAILSMLLFPISTYLEGKGWNRAVSILVSILVLVAVVAGIFLLLGWQISGLSKDLAQSEQKVMQTVDQVRAYISNTLGVPLKEQEAMMKEQQSSASGKLSGMVTGILSGLGGILTDTILVLVYIFLLSFYRDKLRSFVLKLVPATEHKNAIHTMQESCKVASKYLSGLSLMIVCLWILYGIGFSIAGVKHAIFFAILCGILEIIPFVGNITGTALTIIMAFAQGGDGSMILGILAVYATVQFFQTYILEPLVVGQEVNLNPLFTILAIVAGEMVWGVAGMILAIPLVGIAKIIFDHVEPLKPYGYLIGEDKAGDDKKTMKDRIKGLFKK